MQQGVQLALTESHEPVAALALYGIILIILILPMWKIWQSRARFGVILTFLWSSKGRTYLILTLLWMAILLIMLAKTHTGFWNIYIMDKEHLVLDYWFPHTDYTLNPQDVTALMLTVRQYYSKGEKAGDDWIISLMINSKSEYSSVAILSENEAKNVIAALEQWTGLHSVYYRRQGRWGMFSAPERVIPKATRTF